MKKYSARVPLGLLLILVIATTACDKLPQKTRKQKTATALTDLQKATQFGELYPLAAGGAYLVADESIFYVSNGEAIRVKGLPSVILAEVQPLSDGSALLIVPFSNPPALYHLRQDVATTVVEKAGPIMGKTQVSSPNAFHFVEAQRLKRKLKKSEGAQDQVNNSDEP